MGDKCPCRGLFRYFAVPTTVQCKADAILYSELYAALNELEPNQRQLIFSLDFEGETRREYAAELGITHQAVTKRRAKAIEGLRELMGGKK